MKKRTVKWLDMKKVHKGFAQLEPCGYCGTSTDPNDMCQSCWDELQNRESEVR